MRPPRENLFEKAKDNTMTYVAAFHCKNGIVMCADTQETIGDYKNYAEKITSADPYPLAIGGAGASDIIEPFVQELIERFTTVKPATKAEVKKLIQESLRVVYEKDVPVLVLGKQYRTPEFLIAAKPQQDDFCIFHAKGRRLYREVRKGIIGYASAQNNALLNRLHSETLPMHQAVLLASYLVSQSKATDEGVGFDTQIVVVTRNSVYSQDADHIANMEKRAQEFVKLTDAIFLVCADLSIPKQELPERLDKFKDELLTLRKRHVQIAAEWAIADFDGRVLRSNVAYSYLPLGSVFSLQGDGMVSYKESAEETASFKKIMEEVEPEVQKLRASAERSKNAMQSTSQKSEPEK